MVGAAGDDLRECLPHRFPQPLLSEHLSQTADDVTHPAAEDLHQLLLHPMLTHLGLFPAQRVGRPPEVADDRQDVQHTRPATPRLEERSRQTPQAEGAIEQDDQALAVLRIPALHIGLDALHHLRLRPHQAGHTPDLLASRRIARHVVLLPADARRLWIDHEFRERIGRAGLGLDRVDPHQHFLPLLPVLSRPQQSLQRCAVMLVTHDIQEAIFLADRLILLSKRPETIVDMGSVSAPKPRSRELLRTEEFADLHDRLLDRFPA